MPEPLQESAWKYFEEMQAWCAHRADAQALHDQVAADLVLVDAERQALLQAHAAAQSGLAGYVVTPAMKTQTEAEFALLSPEQQALPQVQTTYHMIVDPA